MASDWMLRLPSEPRTTWCGVAMALVVGGCVGTIDAPDDFPGVQSTNGALGGGVSPGGTTTAIAPSTTSGAPGSTTTDDWQTGGTATGGATVGTSAGTAGTTTGTGVSTTSPVTNDGGTSLPEGAIQPAACSLPEGAPEATHLRLDEVAVYQAIKIPLMEGGAAKSSLNAPLIQGRDALIRAFVTPLPDFVGREITGVLQLDNAGSVQHYEARLTPTGASSDDSLATTFNFDVPGADIGPSTQIRLSLHETTCEPSGTDGEPSDSHFPTTGQYALDALATGTLKVKLVPVRYRVSGVDRTPDTSDTVIARMRDAMLSMYPVADVQISVREPYEWTQQVAAAGTGWESLLNAILALGEREAAEDEYFYGLVSTAGSFGSYCQPSGCVAGIAPVPQTGGLFGSARATGGIGVGYDDRYSRITAVHELGHAHGRTHSPCEGLISIDGVDGSYPYSDGSIGTWGYDILTGELKAPLSGRSGHMDVMGYCEPVWVSDYTYRGWAEWSAQVNTTTSPRVITLKEGATTTSRDAARWQSLIAYSDGSSKWGQWRPAYPPAGRAETARLLDAQGALVEEVSVVRMALSDSDSEFVFVASLHADGVLLALSDRTLDLRQTQEP